MLSKEFWNTYFKIYDLLNELIPYDNLVTTIVEDLHIKKGDRILDIGSGTGNIARRVTQQGATVTGFDISPEGAAIHKKKVPGSTVHLGSITEPWPFQDGEFDRAYSNNTFYTISQDDREHVFRELYRVVKPHGRVVVSNIAVGFSPIAIYLRHIRESYKTFGFFRTFYKILRLIIPTIRIFYYNHLIQREHKDGDYDLMKAGEQQKFLKDAGFVNISNDKRVYAEQAIENSADKL